MHEARIMGVYYDHETSLVYTIGEDKKFKVFDLTRNYVIAGKGIDHAWTLDITASLSLLTGLTVDVENKRAFVTNRNGQLYTYDISQVMRIINSYSYRKTRCWDTPSRPTAEENPSELSILTPSKITSSQDASMMVSSPSTTFKSQAKRSSWQVQRVCRQRRKSGLSLGLLTDMNFSVEGQTEPLPSGMPKRFHLYVKFHYG
jgi:hypothetical protein